MLWTDYETMDPSDKTCKRLQQDPNWRRLKTTTSCLCDHFMCFHFCLVPFFSLYVSVVILCLFLVAWYLVVVIYSLCICFASLMVILRLFVDRYVFLWWFCVSLPSFGFTFWQIYIFVGFFFFSHHFMSLWSFCVSLLLYYVSLW